MSKLPVVVVGGGIGGLAVATYVARAGRPVVVYERAANLGGRAQSRSRGEFRFNLGPRALFRGGRGAAVLHELGVSVTGGTPRSSGALALRCGRCLTLPTRFFSLLTTRLLDWRGRFELARIFSSISRLDTDAVQAETVADWLDRVVRHREVRAVIDALLRLCTYANAPERMSAGAALHQLQLTLAKGVTYLDGGWQSLVDGLREAAITAGAEIATGARVVEVEHDGAARGVRLADGTMRPAAAVALAVPPADASALVGGFGCLARWAAQAIPIRAACLSVGLSRLPAPRALFALGIDRPLYFSVHSAVARLAPTGAATIHVAKYLDGDGDDARAGERELEGLLDTVQRGWRECLVERQFLPQMVVANSLVTAASGGIAGRPGPTVPDLRNVYVVGDWVGNEGLLADATLASAKRAAAQIAAKRPEAAAVA